MIRDQRTIFLVSLILTAAVHLLPLVISRGSDHAATLKAKSSNNSISISVKSVSIPVHIAKKDGRDQKREKPENKRKQTSLSGANGAKEAKLSGDFRPEYPHLSRVYEEEGTTRIKVKIDQHGNVVSAEILTSSGFPRLDSQALSSIKNSHFSPALDSDSQPIFSELIQDITFKLEE
ncbi:energy transducer TonB [Bacteriovorax sp. Seq25_V]|uniref:energy transducer TonB n=1 Tax=Bacteriovorax sp. Seq25_V TaxID=1201288 RepID=UPI00038A2FB3|nr:energy transducer TonB [Bacteriovorax sp. Seq25_V]EQC45593.1 TonB-dependent receptor [Bacteriovorax sp. Seq25_V]